MADLLLGTSSWTADGWVGSFYPANAQSRDLLSIYARRFSTVEIDSTFYRIPSPEMVRGWKEHTPDDFIFAAKVPQIITHEKVLVDAENDLANFLKVMDLLGKKLGPLLFQFPYFNKQKFRGLGFFLDRLLPFLANLPKGYQWVVEVRNRQWLSEKLYAPLRKYGVALALVDQAWMPRPKEWFDNGDPITAPFTFIRWIGDRKEIEERTKVWNRTIYDRTEDLREWADVLNPIAGRVKIIYAYANNHYGGYAPDSVELFRRLWERESSSKDGKQDAERTSGPQRRLPGL